MLWFSEHLHLGDEGRAGAQERARMSVGDLFTPNLGFAYIKEELTGYSQQEGTNPTAIALLNCSSFLGAERLLEYKSQRDHGARPERRQGWQQH